MHFFHIDKCSKILLYGVSPSSMSLERLLKKRGYHVLGFIDRQYQQLNGSFDLPVYGPNENSFSKESLGDICIIICLQNALQHQRAADILFKKGFQKILFLPIKLNLNQKHVKNLREKYQYFLLGNFEKLHKIPCFNLLKNKKFFWNSASLNRSLDQRMVWIPLECLYSETDGNFNGMNISMYRPYLSLFSFLEEGKVECDDYFNFLKPAKNIYFNKEVSIDNHFLKHRQELHHVFTVELNRGMDFFIQSAPPAKWNKNGYFSLEDGHHRTVFLFKKGFIKFPVRISDHDFKTWLNIKKWRSLVCFLKQNRINRLPSPIAHPFFDNYPERSNGAVHQIMSALGTFLYGSEMNTWSVLELSPYNAFFSRFFKRAGAQKTVSIEKNALRFELAKKTNTLLHLEQVEIVLSKDFKIKKDERFHVALLFSAFDRYEAHNLNRILSIASATDVLIFWESGENAEFEKNYILENTKFFRYTFLRKQFNESRITELGVFSCND